MEYDAIGYKTIFVLVLGAGVDCVTGEYWDRDEAEAIGQDQADCFGGSYEIQEYVARADYKAIKADIYI